MPHLFVARRYCKAAVIIVGQSAPGAGHGGILRHDRRHGVTAFGLIFTPTFYVVSRWLAGLGRRRSRERPRAPEAPQAAE
jgi:hypothetical protein